jgi:inhibitor of growth protein 3
VSEMPAELPPREPSARIAEKSRQKQQLARKRRPSANAGDILPGINDFADTIEAIPMDVIRHFTLLKEIDAKCVGTTSPLCKLIVEFLDMPYTTHEENAALAVKREELLGRIRGLIRELVPCLEEKMHVAGVAADAMARHVARLDYDFNLIAENEIPEWVQIGPKDHPAIINDSKSLNDGKSAAQSTRSESRREAMAAKRAAAEAQQQQQKGRTATPVNGIVGANGSGGGSGGSGGGGAGGATTTNLSSNGQKPTTRGRPGSKGTPTIPHATLQTSAPPSKRRRPNTEEREDSVGGYGDNSGYDDDPEMGSPVASRPDTPGRRNRQRTRTVTAGGKEEELVYCYCQQVSYGEMVGCDGPECKREWFHLPCIGLTSPPKGQWYCQECAAKYRKKERR